MTTNNDIQSTLTQAQQLLKQVINTKPVIKSVATDLEKTIQKIEHKINASVQQKVTDQWLHIFSVLNEFTIGITKEQLVSHSSYVELPSFWQKKLSEVSTQSNKGDRAEQTLKIEILARFESPSEYANERLAMQVSLLQEQMLSGESIDLKALFIDWLLIGTFDQDDLQLINRIKPIYCK